jgi:hypothetical protein
LLRVGCQSNIIARKQENPELKSQRLFSLIRSARLDVL